MTTNSLYSSIHSMTRAQFVKTFSAIYEHSPWIAEQSYNIASQNSNITPQMLSSIMHKTLMDASYEQKLTLLNAHPQLAQDKLETLTQNSQNEQKNAKLNKADPSLIANIQNTNQTYLNQFGFPFILAVSNKTPHEIYENMQKRINNTKEKEFNEALEQVRLIGLIRLQNLA